MEEKAVLFESFPKQEEFIEAVFSGKYTFILYGGAIRGGKTFALLGVVILLCKIYPGSRWAIVRKDLPALKKNTLPAWNKISPTNSIKSFNRTDMIVTFHNGSEILFYPENYTQDKELNRWKGFEVNGFFFDEINECQKVAFNKAIERAGSYIIVHKDGREAKQPPPIIAGSCNPTFGWVKDDIYTKWKNGILPPHMLYISSRIFDNPHIPKAYIENLKTLPQYEYEVFVNGNWDVQLKTGGEFLKSFELDQHVKPVLIDDSPFHISMDDNVWPYISMSIFQIEKLDNVYYVRQVNELCAIDPENTATKAGRKAKDWFVERENVETVHVYGDPTTKKGNTIDDDKKSFYDKFTDEIKKEHRIDDCMMRKGPSVSLSGDFVNAILSNEIDNIRLVIGENCKNSISDYIKTKQDKDGGVLKKRITDPKTGVSYEEHGHLTDTLRYFICKVFDEEFDKWQNRFSDPSEIVMPIPNKVIRGGI